MAEQRRLTTLLGHLKTSPASSSSSYGSGNPADYRYTLDSGAGILSEEQRRCYEDNGFVVVKGVVAQRDLDIYRERFRQIVTREVEVLLHAIAASHTHFKNHY